jgi:hypothetical protein
VAGFIGVSEDTVLRRTQALVKAGWLIDTGEQKQWEFARTPVRIINVPVIVGLVEAQEKAPPQFAALPQAPPQIAPPQNAAQGSNGSMVIGLDLLCSSSVCSDNATGVPPVAGESKSKEVRQTETLEPKPKPTPHGKRKSCPNCGEPLQRDVNHFLECQVAKGRSSLDEFQGDMVPIPKLDPMDEMDFEDDGYHGQPLFPSLNSPQAEEARQRVEAVGQTVQSRVAEGKTTATATTSYGQPPVSADPPCQVCGKAPRRNPTSDYCIDCWDERQRTGVIPKFAADEARPTGINP